MPAPVPKLSVSGFSLIAGNLRQISVGADGATWGLNAYGQIYSYDFSTQTWINVPGTLSHISVGAYASVWGVNASGFIYRWDPVAQSWDSIPGALAQVAVGGDGDVWGLNAGGQIYQFNSGLQSWSEIPGTLSHLSVGFDGAVWGLNAAGQVYRYNPGTGNFDNVPGTLAQISVGADGDVWGINAGGPIYHFNRMSQGWDNTPGTLAQISVGSGGNVWGVPPSGAISTFNTQTQTWTQVAGSLAQIRASADGSVWGLNAAGNIFELAASFPLASGLRKVPGALAQISVGSDGNVWGLNAANQIWTFNPQTQGWSYIPGQLTQIAVGGEGEIWGLNAANQIWTFNARSQNWTYVPGSLSQIAVGASGTVWGINSADQIYRFNSQTGHWAYVPGSLSQISVGADGDVWGLNSRGQIYEFNSQTQSWMYFSGQLAKISVGSTGNVWGLDATGAVWQFEPQSGSFRQVPGTLSSIAVGFDGSVWGLNSAGQMLQFDAESQSWIPVPGSSLGAIGASSDASVWGISGAFGLYSLQSGSAALPLAITSVSNNSPLPLTPLYLATSGVNSAAPITVQFFDNRGFSVSEQPVRIGADGLLTVGTPPYFDPTTHSVSAGTVSVVVMQEGKSSAPVTVSIQNLPSVASYGVQPGQITHAVLVFDATLLGMRINQLQAIQASAGNTVDTSQALSTLNAQLISTIELRHDVDKVMLNTSVVIDEGSLADGTEVYFDQTTLDMMDRVNAIFLAQTFATLPPPSVVPGGPGSRARPAPETDFSGFGALLAGMETLNGIKDYQEGVEDAQHSHNILDTVTGGTKAADGYLTALTALGVQEKNSITENLGLVAGLLDSGRTAADAIWQDSRFLYGVATGDQALQNSAVQAMQASEDQYWEALGKLSLTLLGGPTAGEGLNAVAGGLQFVGNFVLTTPASQQEADDTQRSVILQPAIVADARGEGFGFVQGTVDISNSTGVAAAQTGIEISGNNITLNVLADSGGNYEAIVPVNSALDWSNTYVGAYDPITTDVISSSTVDLRGLTLTNPVQVPTMTGSCVDTDDDLDDPDCDSSGQVRRGKHAHTAISSGVRNVTANPALPPK